MELYLKHLHVRPELLDEGLDDGLGSGRRRHPDALGRHLLASVVLVLRLEREEHPEWVSHWKGYKLSQDEHALGGPFSSNREKAWKRILHAIAFVVQSFKIEQWRQISGACPSLTNVYRPWAQKGKGLKDQKLDEKVTSLKISRPFCCINQMAEIVGRCQVSG